MLIFFLNVSHICITLLKIVVRWESIYLRDTLGNVKKCHFYISCIALNRIYVYFNEVYEIRSGFWGWNNIFGSNYNFFQTFSIKFHFSVEFSITIFWKRQKLHFSREKLIERIKTRQKYGLQILHRFEQLLWKMLFSASPLEKANQFKHSIEFTIEQMEISQYWKHFFLHTNLESVNVYNVIIYFK